MTLQKLLFSFQEIKMLKWRSNVSTRYFEKVFNESIRVLQLSMINSNLVTIRVYLVNDPSSLFYVCILWRSKSSQDSIVYKRILCVNCILGYFCCLWSRNLVRETRHNTDSRTTPFANTRLIRCRGSYSKTETLSRQYNTNSVN